MEEIIYTKENQTDFLNRMGIKFGEKIPKMALFLSSQPCTEFDLKWAEEMIKKHEESQK